MAAGNTAFIPTCVPARAPLMKRILLIGNSHLIALIDAANRRLGTDGRAAWDLHIGYRDTAFRRCEMQTPGAHLSFILAGAKAPPFLKVGPAGTVALGEEFFEVLREGSDALGGMPDLVVSYLCGNEHSTFSIVEHAVPFDLFVDAGDEACPADGRLRQVIPVDVVRRELTARAQPVIVYAQMLRSVFPGREVLHVLPPPPIADERQLRANPEIFGSLFDTYGVAPAVLRRKVYKLFQQVLTERLLAAGARIVAPPPESIVDGYLPAEWAVGATHADHRYGELVLRELEAA